MCVILLPWYAHFYRFPTNDLFNLPFSVRPNLREETKNNNKKLLLRFYVSLMATTYHVTLFINDIFISLLDTHTYVRLQRQHGQQNQQEEKGVGGVLKCESQSSR